MGINSMFSTQFHKQPNLSEPGYGWVRGGNFSGDVMNQTACPHCMDWGAAHCDEAHCDIAGPGSPGKKECRVCWLRLGGEVSY
jgi:hypothetical protein